MPASPLDSSPYEVLGVTPDATQEELKRAFRRALRESHPDTGGSPQQFSAVQEAWVRIGTPEARALYDSGRAERDSGVFEARAGSERRDTRPRARTHGHPGGWRRERYLDQMREWVGRGATIDDPYDPALIRSAPREIRRTLADALAEEATARALADLGIGFTVWHDVSAGNPDAKVDHVVLGPTGLWALQSEDFGGPVRSRRGELIGEAVAGERPVHDLAARARMLARSWRVRFTGLAVVVPDDDLADPVIDLGSVRGMSAVAVRRSVLGSLFRSTGAEPTTGGTGLFDLRSRISAAVRYV